MVARHCDTRVTNLLTFTGGGVEDVEDVSVD
jgi:hypothetical protein